MAIIEISVAPLGTGTTSISKYVAKCQQVLQNEENIRYELTPMGTVIEGELDELIQIIKKLHEVPFEEGAGRVYTVVKIDDRRDKKVHMEDKVNSVRKKLKGDK